jgi:hypothetical protein
MEESLMANAVKVMPPKKRKYSYRETLEASQKVNWRIEDIIGGDKRLNFAKPFLPESLARVDGMTYLNADEKRILNQVRGNTYLAIFGLVEEFILPFVMDQARPQLQEDDYRTRALLQFAGEEAKHIHLFKRFRAEFEDGFGTTCEVIGPPSAVAGAILSHHPLAVALTTLHIEWMTQRHYLESVKDEQDLDPQFKSLLTHHWMEEAQHAKLDTLMVESIAENCSQEEMTKAIDEYIEIGGFLDGGLKQQTHFEIEALIRATGRKFSDDERENFMEVQHQANRWTFIGSGMTHQNFLTTLEGLLPQGRARVEQIAPIFC